MLGSTSAKETSLKLQPIIISRYFRMNNKEYLHKYPLDHKDGVYIITN